MHPLALVVPLLAVVAGVPFTDPVPGPAPRNQYLARAASDGNDYLALWIDQRSNPPATYATRVASDGRVLDPTGIRIADEDLFSPTMIWSGTSYLIAYSRGNDFWLLRINRDGVVIDGPRLVMQNAQPASTAYDGTHVVVAYSVVNGIHREPRALFLTREADVMRDVKLGDGGEIGPAMLAWNGTHFAAVWIAVSHANTVLSVDGVPFDIDGTLAPVTRLLDDVKELRPSLASDGRDFLMLTYDDNIFRHIARHASADLSMLGSAVVLPAALRDSAMAHWIGDKYVVTGDSGSVISGIRLDREGRMLESEAKPIVGIAFGGPAPGSTSATNGHDLLITWAGVTPTPTDNGGPLDVYGATASGATLERRSSAMLSIAAPRQFDPTVAASARSLLTVWHERGGLYAQRHALDGHPLDPSPIRIADAAQAVTATFNGTDYIVAWTGYNAKFEGELVTRRIPAQGTLRTNGGTRIALYVGGPIALASNGEVTVLTWATREGLKMARLANDATLNDTVPITLTDDGTVGTLSVASNGTDEFLVAWGDTYFTEHGGMNPLNVRAARVTAGLMQLDGGGFDVATTLAAEGSPSVVWNGSEWLVVWQRAGEIRGRRVARNGTLLDGAANDPGVLIDANARLLSIVWSDGYTIAWTEPYPRFGPSSLRTARCSYLGAPLIATAILGDAEVPSLRPVFLVPVGSRNVVAVYARIALEPEYGGVMRAFLTTLDTAPVTPRRRSTRH